MAAAALDVSAAYDINFPADALIATPNPNKNDSRFLNSVGLVSPIHGTATVECKQTEDRLIYHDLSATATLTAAPGEMVLPVVDWHGGWMHSYVYVDYDNDGAFSADELVSYTWLNGKNSLGETMNSNGNAPIAPHEFTLPALAPGNYRMRFKIDWNSADPGGNSSENNAITKQNGAITDVTLQIKAPEVTEPYHTNYSATDVIQRDGQEARCIASLTWTGSINGAQTLDIGQDRDKLVVHDLTGKAFVASAGETVTLTAGWTGSRWMHGYLYIDRNNDGIFTSLTSQAGAARGSELVAYSWLSKYNSLGQLNQTGETGVNPPAFTVPADLAPGLYRMRFKIDWDSADPAGSAGLAGHGGSITDMMLYIPSDAGSAIRAEAVNGALATAGGAALNGFVPAEGVALDVVATPDDGYVVDGIVVESGYPLPEGVTFVDERLAGHRVAFPARAGKDGVFTVSPDYLRGNISITGYFLDETMEPSEGTYGTELRGAKSVDDGIMAITVNGETLPVAASDKYFYARDAVPFVLAPGERVAVSVDYSGTAADMELYIDYNEDGTFNPAEGMVSNELEAVFAPGGEPTFEMPLIIEPGVYRARLMAVGHCVVDFLLAVHEGAECTLAPKALNGIVLRSNGSTLPETVALGTELALKAQPTLPGFEAAEAIIRHGQRLEGPNYVKGNLQWSDVSVPLAADGTFTVPASCTNGDVEIYVLYEESESSEWTKVWGDEFNTGSLDVAKWSYHPRYNATWNRLVAVTDEQRAMVNTFENGAYNSWCIATPEEFTDETQPMISGAIYSHNKFNATYGKFEARIKTAPHTGNFPAFWLMPAAADPVLVDLNLNGWPRDGEIDIWEQVNEDAKSHHTIHSGWTGWRNYCNWQTAPKQESPTSTAAVNNDIYGWHVYAIEWDPEYIKWFVDGREVFKYANMHYDEGAGSNYIEKITWPFDKDFYVILNQSVGQPGGWAKAPDTSFRYHTIFDYVRVYQRKSAVNNIWKGDNGDDPNFYMPGGEYVEPEDIIVAPDAAEPQGPAAIYDVNGRRVAPGKLVPGVYLERKGTQTRKFIVR